MSKPEREAVEGLIAKWREKAVRWSLAGPTVNAQTVDALRYCADELSAALDSIPPAPTICLCGAPAIHCQNWPECILDRSAPTAEDIKRGQQVAKELGLAAPAPPNDLPCPENERRSNTAEESGIRSAVNAAPAVTTEPPRSCTCVGRGINSDSWSATCPIDSHREQAVAVTRDAVLEEAAHEADIYGDSSDAAKHIARAIRALQSTPSKEQPR